MSRKEKLFMNQLAFVIAIVLFSVGVFSAVVNSSVFGVLSVSAMYVVFVASVIYEV